jgi:hypothetical protein
LRPHLPFEHSGSPQKSATPLFLQSAAVVHSGGIPLLLLTLPPPEPAAPPAPASPPPPEELLAEEVGFGSVPQPMNCTANRLQAAAIIHARSSFMTRRPPVPHQTRQFISSPNWTIEDAAEARDSPMTNSYGHTDELTRRKCSRPEVEPSFMGKAEGRRHRNRSPLRFDSGSDLCRWEPCIDHFDKSQTRNLQETGIS